MRLNKEHGLNPTCCTCFWCGEDTGELALLGDSYKGEAPMHMVLNYEPCDACKGVFAQGILLIQTTERAVDDRPPINDGHYPTGRHAVVYEEAVPRMFNEYAVKQVLAHRKALIDRDAWIKLGLPEEAIN